ncbi:MAG: hypothetical protein P1P74_11600 [Desulfuromonadales bacterium]|nr:hypothetical protein [Desulfuromonadales bacterium]
MDSKIIIIGISILFLLAPGISPPAMGEENPGKLPPKVQKYKSGDVVEDYAWRVLNLYTKDDPDKVADFYRKTLGMDPISGRTFYLGEDVLNLSRPSEADETVYLTVSAAAERERGDLTEAKLFGTMQGEMQKNKMLGSPKHSDREYQQVQQKYAHLVKSWYPDFDVKEKLDKCSNEKERNIDAIEDSNQYSEQDEDEAAARIQQLIAQGRYEEAMQIAKSIAGEGRRVGEEVQQENMKDYWDYWLECLDEIDRHAYPTQIAIGLVQSHFRAGTGAERKRAASRLAGQERQGSDQEDQSESSKESTNLKDKGLKKLKGMFGF